MSWHPIKHDGNLEARPQHAIKIQITAWVDQIMIIPRAVTGRRNKIADG
jgi:hypothetical protein